MRRRQPRLFSRTDFQDKTVLLIFADGQGRRFRFLRFDRQPVIVLIEINLDEYEYWLPEEIVDMEAGERPLSVSGK